MKTDWEAIHDRFDPEEPVPVDRPTWRVPRAYSPAEQLKPRLNRPFGDKRFLVIGTVGTGKSTELYQLAEARTERDFVVLVDLLAHFVERVNDLDALNHVQPWEVVFLIGLHIYRAASDAGHVWSSDAVEALRDARRGFATGDEAPEIDIPKLASALTVLIGGVLDGAAGVVTAGLGKVIGAGRWSLPIGRRARALDQDDRVKDMLGAVNGLIDELEDGRQRRVAVFVDGLDRVREMDTVRTLFVESSLLGKLRCTTVVAGPIAVRRAGLGGMVRGFEIHVLANVPVIDPAHVPVLDVEAHPDPMRAIGLALHPIGRQFFRETWAARTRDLAPDAIPNAQIDRMAWASGGRAREFVRMVRMVAGATYDAGLDTTTADIVDRVVDDLRGLIELGINTQHLRVLREVLDDARHRLPDDDAVDEMLDKYWLLPYPNKSEWYHPNPLLLIHQLRGSPDSDGR